MSHTIPISDDLYERVSALAAREGRTIEQVVAEMLGREVGRGAAETTPGRLDWETASAEEIIADLRASRVECERPVEL
jgi:predicted transcriptional regulator